MRTSIAAFLMVVSGAAAAQQPPAQDLGTLFFSPQEREALERLRRGAPAAGQGAVMRPDPVVTGYVKRSDGKSTVFLDKQPYPARNARMQGLLEPKIVERFEPIPLPPAPATPAADGNGETAGKPAPATKAPSAAPKGGNAE